mmetsp:Transcript_69545/g.185101  ORF Transcript_69545/g.185101 Transcript_69545/m.185101 type:complete len:222 (+) Transcript_69545:921-1586(+)
MRRQVAHAEVAGPGARHGGWAGRGDHHGDGRTYVQGHRLGGARPALVRCQPPGQPHGVQQHCAHAGHALSVHGAAAAPTGSPADATSGTASAAAQLSSVAAAARAGPTDRSAAPTAAASAPATEPASVPVASTPVAAPTGAVAASPAAHVAAACQQDCGGVGWGHAGLCAHELSVRLPLVLQPLRSLHLWPRCGCVRQPGASVICAQGGAYGGRASVPAAG